MNWVEWLDGWSHARRRGHWPVWYNLGAGERQCVNCLRGGHKRRLPRPALRLLPRAVPL